MSACNDGSAAAVQPAMFVRTEIVQPRARQGSVTLTGEVQARFRADLSFRVGGRVRERLVDVGAHVDAGELLARLDAAEQQADFDAASAAVTAAQAQLRVARATFDRQSRLIARGFTTRVAFDQAQEALRTAEGSLESRELAAGHGQRGAWLYRAARRCSGCDHGAKSRDRAGRAGGSAGIQPRPRR